MNDLFRCRTADRLGRVPREILGNGHPFGHMIGPGDKMWLGERGISKSPHSNPYHARKELSLPVHRSPTARAEANIKPSPHLGHAPVDRCLPFNPGDLLTREISPDTVDRPRSPLTLRARADRNPVWIALAGDAKLFACACGYPRHRSAPRLGDTTARQFYPMKRSHAGCSKASLGRASGPLNIAAKGSITLGSAATRSAARRRRALASSPNSARRVE